MNYFELYPGDYMRDTSRLTLIEHGAYLKLLMTYYAEEVPLPADYNELYAIAVALSAADKAAVRKVADRYFPISEDGLRHKKRCDEEIAKAQKRIETARNNGGKGGRPATPKENPTGNPVDNPAGSDWVPKTPVFDNPEITQRLTHSGEALHTPHATLQADSSRQAERTLSSPTDTGLACLAMRKAGCFQTNPTHPDLIAAIGEGVTAEALAATVTEALNATPPIRKPFAWAIATARGRHADGAKQFPTGETHANHSTPSRKLSVGEQVREHARAALSNTRDIIEGETAHARPRLVVGQDG